MFNALEKPSISQKKYKAIAEKPNSKIYRKGIGRYKQEYVYLCSREGVAIALETLGLLLPLTSWEQSHNENTITL